MRCARNNLSHREMRAEVDIARRNLKTTNSADLPARTCLGSRPLSLGENRGDRFVRKSIKRNDRHRDVLFFGVLDLVVTDSKQALHEHHHRWYAGTGNFCRVMQWARGQPHRRAACFFDRQFARVDQRRIEQDGIDLPETIPVQTHIAFAGESFAGRFRIAQHRCERRGVEMSLIERDHALLNDTGDDARLGGA